MDYKKEFKKFATKKHGINSMYYDQIVSSMTPYIIEEVKFNLPRKFLIRWLQKRNEKEITL